MQIEWIEFETRDKLAEGVAERIAADINADIQFRNTAAIFLPGGQTPRALYRAISYLELTWNKIHISLTDERCVSDGHPQSNATVLWQELLSTHPDALWYPLWRSEYSSILNTATLHPLGLETIAHNFSAPLLQIPHLLTWVLLGMGNDGHVASLFPECTASQHSFAPISVEQQQQRAPIVLTEAPDFPKQRVSWRPEILRNTKHLGIYITGATKKQQCIDYLHAGQSPIRRLLHPIAEKVYIFYAP
ncbi:MAG: 6-phosphogluconolactonase [Pseudomonadota bacterium]